MVDGTIDLVICHSRNFWPLFSWVRGDTFFKTPFSFSILFSASSGWKTRSRILEGRYDSGIASPLLIILFVFSVFGNWGMCKISSRFSWVLSRKAKFTGNYLLLLMQFCHLNPILLLKILVSPPVNPVSLLSCDKVLSSCFLSRKGVWLGWISSSLF